MQSLNSQWNQMTNYKRSVLISSLSLTFGLLAEINFRRLPSLPTTNPTCVFPSLSIIVPARDENSWVNMESQWDWQSFSIVTNGSNRLIRHSGVINKTKIYLIHNQTNVAIMFYIEI